MIFELCHSTVCVVDIMHGRGRMTVDPRIPTIPGRSTLGFHRLGRHCLPQVKSESPSSVEGAY